MVLGHLGTWVVRRLIAKVMMFCVLRCVLVVCLCSGRWLWALFSYRNASDFCFRIPHRGGA